MASIPGIIVSRLARQAEAKLRFQGSVPQGGLGWLSMTVDQLARWLFYQRPRDQGYTYIQYRNIARNVVANARDAATMMANPDVTILDLKKAPGVGPNFPEYEYRTVVVGRDASGNEVFSTLHYVYSSTELTGNQVIEQARQNMVEQLVPPGFRQSDPDESGQIVDFSIYIVSAGTR